MTPQRKDSISSHKGVPNALNAGVCSLPQNEMALISEFMLALAEEIEAIKKGRGGSIITVYDGVLVRREGLFYVYVFTTESPLIVMDDAPAEVKVGAQKYAGQIVSVQGSEVAVGIDHDFGRAIAEAQLITNLWYLLEALRKRYEEVLNGQRTLDTRLGQRLLGFVPTIARIDVSDLNLPSSLVLPNDDQKHSIRAVCGSDIHFIWGPPGTGKTMTIGFLVAALVKRNLRTLIVSHTNVATDHAIKNAAELLQDTEDYHGGKLVRLGNFSPDSNLPEMVIPENIKERLGRHLNEKLATLQSELTKVQQKIGFLSEIQSLLDQQIEALQKLPELEINLQGSTAEHQSLKIRKSGAETHLSEAKNRLSLAHTTGKLKRFFLGLDPVKLQNYVNNVERELGVILNTISANLEKQTQLKLAVERTKTEEKRCSADAQARLASAGLDAESFLVAITNLTRQSEEHSSAIRAIESELSVLQAKIVREAKVVATSLTKATISRELDDQKFDVLVIDEASMAPLPSLYFASGLATQKVVVVGDFRQLPPICLAETNNAKKWLARDVFDHAGIQRAIDEGNAEPRMTLLHQQYRMHPDISGISNHIIYGNRLVDKLDKNALADISTFLSKSPLGHSPLVLCDVSSINPWSSRLERGGRYNLYSAVLSAELAKRAVLAGIEHVGVISPYVIHTRLIKMVMNDVAQSQELTEDVRARLRHIKVSNVHKFQGLEQELIIFDIAEGPPLKPSTLIDGVDLASQAAKLINVAITRPKAQLVLVANVEHLKSTLRHDSIIMRVIEQMHRHATLVDSQEIVGDYFCVEFERWALLLDPHNDDINPNDSTLYTDRNFYAAFFADLRKSNREIIIVSPFVAANRAQQFFNLLRYKVTEGVQVRVFTRPLSEQQGELRRQGEIVFDELKRIGVQLVERRGLHQKFAFIDRQVAWEGSLNILSQSEGRSTEHMRRLPFANTCEELIELHDFGNDSEVEAGTRGHVETERKCKQCGSTMVLVRGPNTIFLGCIDYPKCRVQPQFIRRGERILTNVICSGKNDLPCGKPMVAMQGPYGVYLRCSDPHCSATRNVKG